MEHNLTEQAIKDIQIVLSWLKNGSEMTPYNSIQRIIEQNALLRGIVDEKDKLLDDAIIQSNADSMAFSAMRAEKERLQGIIDDAREQKPVGEYRVNGEWVQLYAAAPVPAQPAAEGDAK